MGGVVSLPSLVAQRYKLAVFLEKSTFLVYQRVTADRFRAHFPAVSLAPTPSLYRLSKVGAVLHSDIRRRSIAHSGARVGRRALSAIA
jgi:hypothetical protein